MVENFPCVENNLDFAGRLGARIMSSMGAMDAWAGLHSDAERGACTIALIERNDYLGGLFPPEELEQLREPSAALIACAQNHASGKCPVYCLPRLPGR